MNVTHVTTPEQLDDAYYVRKVVFIDEQNVPEEEEMDQFDETSEHFVVYDGDKPVGAGRFRVVDGYGKVERICIMKSHRGKGLGNLLIHAIEAYAKDTNVAKTKLNAQTHAEAFYKKLGYETVSDEFMDAGIPHVTMIKNMN
ncbi:GNAT family N-acetyltransferase [Bacillus sp. HMF5848]|uniref:GNAT family N-acetyltransferase n=1 Tax=Bacillus sp. HMF5848 TaxID=2495421 RepID=UPI000F77728A|nr:GNAT family N-acetyltransferase [Bacillus sp. HMF5848]RSK29282.1 GNAT family N-acetyltransferase [Bacillus sp. HMF5848]